MTDTRPMHLYRPTNRWASVCGELLTGTFDGFRDADKLTFHASRVTCPGCMATVLFGEQLAHEQRGATVGELLQLRREFADAGWGNR